MGTQEAENYPPAAKDGRSAQEKAIDDWLPITSSRNAKWWYSAFHNVTAMVGAGVLSLPYAMSELGWSGTWHRCADPIMDHHAVHAVADGGDARDGAREAVRPVPRARAARVRREAGALDRRAAAARRRGRRQHRLHGHRRQVAEEVPRRDLREQLQGHQAHLLHHDLRLRPLRPLPAPKLQLHLRRVPRRRRHVAQLLHHRVGRVGGQREDCQRRLPPARHDVDRQGVRLLQRAGRRRVRLRRTQRGAGDPGDNPVDTGEAVQEADVEGRRRRLHHRRALLLPRRARRLLGVRQPRRRQHPHHAVEAQMAHRPRQHDGCRPCHRKLPDLCHAGVRHDRDRPRQEAPFPSRPDTSPHRKNTLRCVHDVHRDHLPVLRWIARVLWWIRLCADYLLPSLHHVASNLQAKKVQPLMVHQLDLHHSWSDAHDPVTNRRTQADHHRRQDIQVLLIDYMFIIVISCGCKFKFYT